MFVCMSGLLLRIVCVFEHDVKSCLFVSLVPLYYDVEYVALVYVSRLCRMVRLTNSCITMHTTMSYHY